MIVTQPTPAFPVTWRHPTDETMMWTHDRLHFPDSIPPIEFSLIEDATDAGITKAARFYDIPITAHDRHINGYLFVSMVSDELEAAEATRLAAQSESKLRAAMANLCTLWETEWLPEIKSHLDWWEAQETQNADWADLHTLLNATFARLGRLWEIHFQLFFPGMLAISHFIDLYEDIFEEAEPLAAYKALTGFDSKTMESAHALWQLSREILAAPALYQLFTAGSAAEVLAKLPQTAGLEPFPQKFAAYLAEHGYRADKLSIYYPFWIEDPTPVIATLQDYILQPDRDLQAEMAQKIAARNAAVAELRTQLKAYPAPIREEAEFLLKAAQEGSYLKEVHGYWIDYRGGYCARRVLLAIGERLAAAGVIATPDDLFYFYLTELRTLLTQLAENAAGNAAEFEDYQLRFAARRALAATYTAITPPHVLGTIPDGPLPDDPISRMFFRVEGAAPPPTTVPNELHGLAGSPGLAEGRVKIVYRLKDAEKLAPGDILVAEATAPPWTPFFAGVAGVITDTGGPLSHCAVIAREYGIPAVVGTGTATSTLYDGQRVRIDGSRGIIHLLEKEEL